MEIIYAETEDFEFKENYSDLKSIVAPKSLEELKEQLRKVFSYDRVNIDYVIRLLESYKSNPKDWKQYAKFDKHRYTRNLVDTGNGKYNLMALCWGEGHGSSIHDHANADCFVKVLDGHLTETRFAWPDKDDPNAPLKQIGCETFGRDAATYMSDELGLHRMENKSHTNRTVTLHLYVPPFKSCRTFDENTAQTNEVKMTFWSEYGKRTPFKETCNREAENN